MEDARGIVPLHINGNTAKNWRIWISRFRNNMCASELDKKAENIRCAQLLHYIGEDGYQVFKTFTFTDAQKDKIEELIKKFENHFLPRENTSYERYVFFNMKQKSGQPIEQFITSLREQALKCKFETLENSLIKYMIISGIKNPIIREKLLQDDTITLEHPVVVNV